MKSIVCALMTIACAFALPLAAEEEWPASIEPLLRTVDLNVGETCEVKFSDGKSVAVKLLDLKETRDDLRQAVREARATVEVGGQTAVVTSGNYRLPIPLGDVQIDCPVTKGYVQDKVNRWSLDKDARIRLWPAGSPWIQPGTYAYPVRQAWFAGNTQMGNEPVFVDGVEDLAKKPIYYHYGQDIGGAEGLVEVLSATDGVVVTSESTRATVRDGRGWLHGYGHLFSVEPDVKPGTRIKMGQKIGLLGKESGSGGWSHLHYQISSRQPNGHTGILDSYPFLWQAYHAQRGTELQAVARPHRVAWIGQDVVLDGSLSWSALGPKHITGYRWIRSDGTKAEGPTVAHRYAKCGEYSEILQVADADGRVDYDFAVVQVYDREHPELRPPAIHAAYWPSLDLKAGDEITFKVRSFGVGRTEGSERWDFGDGTPPVETQSLPVMVLPDTRKSTVHAKDGYAVTTHRYAKAGQYIVSVSRTNDRGETATARLHVRIEK